MTAADTVVNSPTDARLDYCNNLLPGCSKQIVVKPRSAQRKLHGVYTRQSSRRPIAATIASCKHAITFGRYCRDRVISLLHGPIVTGGDCGLERIRFKRCLLVYKVMNSMHRRRLTYSKYKGACRNRCCSRRSSLCSRRRSHFTVYTTDRHVDSSDAWNSLTPDIWASSSPATF